MTTDQEHISRFYGGGTEQAAPAPTAAEPEPVVDDPSFQTDAEIARRFYGKQDAPAAPTTPVQQPETAPGPRTDEDHARALYGQPAEDAAQEPDAAEVEEADDGHDRPAEADFVRDAAQALGLDDRAADQLMEKVAAERASWLEEAQRCPVLSGGEGFDANVEVARSALDVVDPSGDVRQLLAATNLDNHPAMARMLMRVGRIFQAHDID